jgi:hypothetical protein
MSISEEIETHCKRGRLFLLTAADIRTTPITRQRVVYASRDIYRFLNGGWNNPAEKLLSRKLQADIDNFILGRAITAALTRKRHRGSNMARLEPARDEVWEIRVDDANPQLRVFGRFAKVDVFVALVGPIRRPDLRGPLWDAAKRRCREEWANFFANPPVIGIKVHDYISANVLAV